MTIKFCVPGRPVPMASNTFSAEEIAFFAAKASRLPLRKTKKPGAMYESYVAGADCSVSPNRDLVIVRWNYYYYATIALLFDERQRDEWGVSRDSRYLVFVEHPGVINDCCGTIFSSGGYVTKEACWRGVMARMRRVLN